MQISNIVRPNGRNHQYTDGDGENPHKGGGKNRINVFECEWLQGKINSLSTSKSIMSPVLSEFSRSELPSSILVM